MRCGRMSGSSSANWAAISELVRHINAHRYYLGKQQDREISRDEAVTSWYDTVYLPIVQVIREQHQLKHFPNRTEADLYRWIMEHRWYMRERSGADPGPQDATEDYVALYGQKGLAGSVEGALRGALQMRIKGLGIRIGY